MKTWAICNLIEKYLGYRIATKKRVVTSVLKSKEMKEIKILKVWGNDEGTREDKHHRELAPLILTYPFSFSSLTLYHSFRVSLWHPASIWGSPNVHSRRLCYFSSVLSGSLVSHSMGFCSLHPPTATNSDPKAFPSTLSHTS